MYDSYHWTEERKAREEAIKKLGIGHELKVVEQDRGHKNGPELVHIMDNGVIVITNKRTGRMITKLIARPNQIRKYWADAPQELIRLAMYHQSLRLNMI